MWEPPGGWGGEGETGKVKVFGFVGVLSDEAGYNDSDDCGNEYFVYHYSLQRLLFGMRDLIFPRKVFSKQSLQ